MSIRILIADDHPVVRLGIRNLLQQDPGVEIVGEAADGAEAVAISARLAPDILLLDQAMPKMNGLDVLREVGAIGGIRVLIVTARLDPDDIIRALQLGARGILLKESAVQRIQEAVEAVASGRYWINDRPVDNVVETLQSLVPSGPAPQRKYGLTPRETQIIEAVVEGCTNQLVAERFGITEDTVKRHLTHIYDKLGVSTRLELALFAIHQHVLQER